MCRAKSLLTTLAHLQFRFRLNIAHVTKLWVGQFSSVLLQNYERNGVKSYAVFYHKDYKRILSLLIQALNYVKHFGGDECISGVFFCLLQGAGEVISFENGLVDFRRIA
jgi:hypothetical protein